MIHARKILRPEVGGRGRERRAERRSYFPPEADSYPAPAAGI